MSLISLIIVLVVVGVLLWLKIDASKPLIEDEPSQATAHP